MITDHLQEMVNSLCRIGSIMKIEPNEDEGEYDYALRVCIQIFGQDSINTNTLRQAKQNATEN